METVLIEQIAQLREKNNLTQQEKKILMALDDFIYKFQGATLEESQSNQNKDSKHFYLPKVKTLLKITLITTASVAVIICAVELLRLFLGEELISVKLKNLLSQQGKLLLQTRAVKDGVDDVRSNQKQELSELEDAIDKTDKLADAVAEIADAGDVHEKLARADVELFKEVEQLKCRLNEINENSFLSFSDAIAMTPPRAASPNGRRGSIACESPTLASTSIREPIKGRKRSLSFIFRGKPKK
jgi:hypothetical protein